MTEYPWIKSYPEGVSWNAELPVGPVYGILDYATSRWPDRPAMEFMGKRNTYRELAQLVARAAKGFQALGVGPGVHVGLYLPNTPHYVIAFFGALKAGGTVVNYSPLDAEKVLQHKIADSRTDFMVTLNSSALYPQMGRLLGKTRLKKIIVGSVAEMSAQPEAVQAALKKAGQVSEYPADERHMSFQQLLANDGAYRAHPIDDATKSMAVLQYTGGTTGLPKGAMLTHANLTAATEQYWITVRGRPFVCEEGVERLLAAIPLFHIYALTVDLLFGVRMGAEIILHPRFDLDAVVKDLAAKKVTIFPGVPTMYAAVLSHPQSKQFDLTSLKFCGSGGAPLPVEVLEKFQAQTGCKLVEGWGMTETSPSGTFTPVNGIQKGGSCGMPMPGIVLKFADIKDPTRYVPIGERGELCIKGPNVMQGYWQNPQATAESMTADGFFRTGDVGYMDEDGFVFIVDRIKDMLLCSGYNVYPRVIEEAIYEHPSVEAACVIGVSDAYRGQSPKAFIQLKPGAPSFTLEELQAFLKTRLGKHEMVQAMEIRKELPKTPAGKLSKKDLREEEEAKRTVAAKAVPA